MFHNCGLRSTFRRSDDNSTQGSDVVYVIECLNSVAASTHMQSFVRFGWPAVDPLCVSLLTANADAYKIEMIAEHFILDNVYFHERIVCHVFEIVWCEWLDRLEQTDGAKIWNCVAYNRFESLALQRFVFIAACVSLLTASIESI